MKMKAQLKVFLVRLAKAEKDGEHDVMAEKAVARILKLNGS